MENQTFLLLSHFLFILYTVPVQDGFLQLRQNGFYSKQHSAFPGVVNNECQRIFEDSSGRLWIGSNEFDKKSVTVDPKSAL